MVGRAGGALNGGGFSGEARVTRRFCSRFADGILNGVEKGGDGSPSRPQDRWESRCEDRTPRPFDKLRVPNAVEGRKRHATPRRETGVWSPEDLRSTRAVHRRSEGRARRP